MPIIGCSPWGDGGGQISYIDVSHGDTASDVVNYVNQLADASKARVVTDEQGVARYLVRLGENTLPFWMTEEQMRESPLFRMAT